MNPSVIRGVLLVIAFAMIVPGVLLNWGLGWALLAGGVLLILRVATEHFAYMLLRQRGHSDG
jgi:hypothetical protein